MTNSIFFYSPDSLNGRYQVMTTEDLSGRGVTKISSNAITMQKNTLYKNLNNFWVTAKKLEEFKSKFQAQVAYF